MTGYVRKDTTNNIADGNVINAADLDSEFDGVQDGFNASTGHTHGGAAGEGAPITRLGPTQDVTASAVLLAPKTTNTVDIGSSALKFKDLFLAGNASVGGTLAVTGATTLSAALTYGGVTLSNAVTGTGNMVLSTSPTLVTPVLGVATGTSFQGIIGNVTPAAGSFTTLGASSTATLNTLASSGATLTGGTINGMTVGATTASTGNFTTLGATGNVTLGDASTDTVTVNGKMGFGAAPSTNTGIYYRATASQITGSTSGYGLYMDVPFASDVTSSAEAARFRVNTAAASFTVSSATGLRVANAIKGAGSTITNLSGLYIDDLTSGTNNYGITSAVSSGTNKWNIYASGTADNYFAGNVGIGTSSPSSLLSGSNTNLTIEGTAGGDIAFKRSGGTTRMAVGVTSGDVGYVWTTTNTSILFGTNNTEGMRLTSTGLGIGTSSPNTNLEISTTVDPILRLNNSTNAVTNGADIGEIQFYTNDASTSGTGVKAFVKTVAQAFGANQGGADLVFGTAAYAVGDASEKMRLDKDGNVGIGTSSPSASAILDAQSTTKGVRMPNMTTTQKNAIASPAAGLMVFDTTLAKLCVYTGAAWQTITSA